MTTASPARVGLAIGAIRPRFRRREFGLLVLVALALVAGSVSLGTTRSVLAGDGLAVRPADPGRLLVYLIALFGAHLAQVLAGRRTDQVLLPAVGLLGGLGLLLMERLPQDLAGSAFGNALGLASVQLVWLLIAVTVITVLAIVVRSDTWLRRYKYTWAAVGIGLLLLTFVFGKEANGALLTIQIGPFSGQPTELLKVILVVFLAGYLSEFRPLLAEANTQLGPIRLPPLPYLLPMIAMWPFLRAFRWFRIAIRVRWRTVFRNAYPFRGTRRTKWRSDRRHRTRLRGGDDRGRDQLPRLDRRLVGRAVLAPEGLHAGLHDRARLHGEDQARVRPAQREDHRPLRRPGRQPPRLGRRHRGDAGHAPNYPIIGDADFNVSKLYGMLPRRRRGRPGRRGPRPTTRRCATSS